MIDTHTHLNFKAFESDWRQVVERSVRAGVETMVVVGTDLKSSQRAVEMAEESEALYASIGVHPHHARGITDSRFKIQDLRRRLEKLATHKKAVAIGEVGLDYHTYTKSKYQIKNDKKGRARIVNLQKRLLGMQIEIAKKFNKPMIIHSREAKTEVLDTIEHFSKSDGKLPGGVFHCFDGGKKYLKQVIEAGFMVGMTGNITYREDRAKVAREIPLDRLLLETDCPYMKPRTVHPGGVDKRHPRGEESLRSEPGEVRVIADFHARQRGVKLEEVGKKTDENASKLFGL